MTHAPTTAAAAIYKNFREFDPNDHEYMIWDVELAFNGQDNRVLGEIRFHMAANAATKQAAVRQAVNDHLQSSEPGVVLTNAVIQIAGQPV